MVNNHSKDISLYFHIPFCDKKCHYCHFYVIPNKEPHKQQYLIALKKEWARWNDTLAQYNIVSIYFGGGTPALIGPKAIEEIVNWVAATHPIHPQIEITLEANPENITYTLMHDYANAGITRASIGIQTLNDPLLIKLGRTHSGRKALEAVHETFKAGIENITIDLMYDLPTQTLEDWMSTLKNVTQLPLKHISLYNLTVEPHTVFFKQKNQVLREMPDEECSLKMYEQAVEIFGSHHFHQYEISAFCQTGWQSHHNCGYWTGRPFIGLGPSAFSYWNGKRFSNIANLNRYCSRLEANESPIDFEEQLDSRSSARENLAIQMRLVEGVNLAFFQEKFGLLEKETWLTLEKLQQQELLIRNDDKIQLTRKGILFYDTVATEII